MNEGASAKKGMARTGRQAAGQLASQTASQSASQPRLGGVLGMASCCLLTVRFLLHPDPRERHGISRAASSTGTGDEYLWGLGEDGAGRSIVLVDGKSSEHGLGRNRLGFPFAMIVSTTAYEQQAERSIASARASNSVG